MVRRDTRPWHRGRSPALRAAPRKHEFVEGQCVYCFSLETRRERRRLCLARSCLAYSKIIRARGGS